MELGTSGREPDRATPPGRNADKELIKGAPGFDKDHRPNMADHGWAKGVSKYYGTKP